MKDLNQKRRDLLEKLEAHSNCLRGSITQVCTACNRANCICPQKSLPRAYRLTYKDRDQKTKTLYIRRSQLEEVRTMVANYKRIREITEQLIEINVEIFKENKRASKQ